MLISLIVSAFLAGPAVAGVLLRQNSVTIRATGRSNSTVFSYAPLAEETSIIPSVPSGTASGVSGGVTIAPGINPVNGLPAAPPVRPSNKTEDVKSIMVRPIVFTTIAGVRFPIYQTKPTSTFAVPRSSSASASKSLSSKSTSTSMSISFHTFTPTPGVKVTVTNSPSASSSTATAPPSHSALVQAPPQSPTTSSAAPTATSSSKPAPTSTESSSSTPSSTIESGASAAPAPTEWSATEVVNPYPYPIKQSTESSESTTWNYPYPTNEERSSVP